MDQVRLCDHINLYIVNIDQHKGRPATCRTAFLMLTNDFNNMTGK